MSKLLLFCLILLILYTQHWTTYKVYAQELVEERQKGFYKSCHANSICPRSVMDEKEAHGVLSLPLQHTKWAGLCQMKAVVSFTPGVFPNWSGNIFSGWTRCLRETGILSRKPNSQAIFKTFTAVNLQFQNLMSRLCKFRSGDATLVFCTIGHLLPVKW